MLSCQITRPALRFRISHNFLASRASSEKLYIKMGKRGLCHAFPIFYGNPLHLRQKLLSQAGALRLIHGFRSNGVLFLRLCSAPVRNKCIAVPYMHMNLHTSSRITDKTSSLSLLCRRNHRNNSGYAIPSRLRPIPQDVLRKRCIDIP